MGVETVAWRERRKEHGVFRLEPGDRLLLAGGAFRRHSGARQERERPVPVSVQQFVGVVSGVQVVVKHPVSSPKR